MSAIVSIGGSIHTFDKGVLPIFSDCISGFEVIRIAYGHEMRCTLPGGFRVYCHWGLDRIECDDWIRAHFPHAEVTYGVHRLPETAIKGVMSETI